MVEGKPIARLDTKPRVWVGGPSRFDYLEQGVLEQLARTCTKSIRGQAYRDPEPVKCRGMEAGSGFS